MAIKTQQQYQQHKAKMDAKKKTRNSMAKSKRKRESLRKKTWGF